MRFVGHLTLSWVCSFARNIIFVTIPGRLYLLQIHVLEYDILTLHDSLEPQDVSPRGGVPRLQSPGRQILRLRLPEPSAQMQQRAQISVRFRLCRTQADGGPVAALR